jgi:hypothetical protein
LSALAALRVLLSEAMQLGATEEPTGARIISPDSYRGDRHAAALDLCLLSPLPELAGAQRWSALPDQTQQTLAGLLTRLLIAHAGGVRQELDEPPEGDSDER